MVPSLLVLFPGALCSCADSVTPRSSPGGAIPGPGYARLQTKPGYLGPWERGMFPLSNTTENLNLIFSPYAEPGGRHQRGSFCFCFNQFKPQSSLSFTAPCRPPEAQYDSLLRAAAQS